jgi:hypothetical protein
MWYIVTKASGDMACEGAADSDKPNAETTQQQVVLNA